MTLLELLNLSTTLLLLPNNDGQPAIFPTPSFGDYLIDLAHYLRTHAPYVDDLYQTGIRKYLVAEAVFIYFFLIAGLRRFRLAQQYLLAKLVVFATLFLTSGTSYWNFYAWFLSALALPLELFVVFMFATWFFHRHAIPKIRGRKSQTYPVYVEYIVKRFRKDGSVYWEEIKELYATVGLFTQDRLFYHGSFMLLYSYAKYRMFLGNPLAYFYKLHMDHGVDNRFLVAGVTFDWEFGYPNGMTSKFTDDLYRQMARKHPLLQEFHRHADCGDFLLRQATSVPDPNKSNHEAFVTLVHLPLTVLGIKVPWVARQERLHKWNAERWLPEAMPTPYEWVAVDTSWPESSRPAKTFAALTYRWYESLLRKAVPFKAPLPAQPNTSTIRSWLPARTLSQRIIDNLTVDWFISKRESVLNPDSKLYSKLTSTEKVFSIGYAKSPSWRFRPNPRKTNVAERYAFTDNTGVTWFYSLGRDIQSGPGWTKVQEPHFRFRNRRYRSWIEQGYEYSLATELETPNGPFKSYEWGGPLRIHPIVTPVEKTWQKRAVQPELRTGFAGFNFDQFAPLMELDSISNLRYGLLFILALSSLTVYSIILAGWSSNSKYAFLGALRSAAQMISYEVSISLALLPVILLSGSLNLTAIVYGQIGTVWYLFPLLPIALVFLVSMLAETNRTPFDLPEAEAELVAGYNVDYSSLPFAMFFLGEYSNMILISVLFCLLFLGGWDGAVLALQEPYILTIKAAFVWVFFVIVRATLPRYRYDQLMDIGWKAFLPFAGSFLVFVIGLIIFLDVAPVVEEIALEDLYGAPAPFLAEGSWRAASFPDYTHPFQWLPYCAP